MPYNLLLVSASVILKQNYFIWEIFSNCIFAIFVYVLQLNDTHVLNRRVRPSLRDKCIRNLYYNIHVDILAVLCTYYTCRRSNRAYTGIQTVVYSNLATDHIPSYTWARHTSHRSSHASTALLHYHRTHNDYARSEKMALRKPKTRKPAINSRRIVLRNDFNRKCIIQSRTLNDNICMEKRNNFSFQL